MTTLTIYSNPVNDKFLMASEKMAEWQVLVDLSGRVFTEKSVHDLSTQFDLSRLIKGKHLMFGFKLKFID